MNQSEIAVALRRFRTLPDSAFVSFEVAAAHDGVSVRTVRRRYPKVWVSDHRRGINVGYLRHRKQEVVTA